MELEEEHDAHEQYVLVEEVEHQEAQSHTMIMAMHEQQTLQHAELGKGEVGTARCLATLSSHDADADMSLLDHGHIVGTVTNGCGVVVLIGRLDERNHFALLQRT